MDVHGFDGCVVQRGSPSQLYSNDHRVPGTICTHVVNHKDPHSIQVYWRPARQDHTAKTPTAALPQYSSRRSIRGYMTVRLTTDRGRTVQRKFTERRPSGLHYQKH